MAFLSENPCFAKAKASEFISTRLANSLCVYTDGSLGDEGGGAAFCIPALGKVAKRYHLPHLNIFTIELYAILMALTFINDLSKLPVSLTILSDSMAALAAIESERPSTREDIVLDIRVLAHQLITSGCEVGLQWVPAHVGVTDNEMADAHAKLAAAGRGAYDSQLVPAMADIKHQLTKTSWDLWARDFAARADGWRAVDLSPPTRTGSFRPNIPPHLARIIHRIRAGVWKTKFLNTKCECGEDLSPHHVVFNCNNFKTIFKPTIDRLTSLGLPLCLESIFAPQGDMGWGPATEVASKIPLSSIGANI